MTDFTKIFRKDKNLKEQSILTYSKSLKVIKDNVGTIDIRRYKYIISTLEGLYPNKSTLRTFLSTFLKYIEIKRKNRYDIKYKYVKDIIDNINKEKFNEPKKLTEDEKKNNWEDIVKIVEDKIKESKYKINNKLFLLSLITLFHKYAIRRADILESIYSNNFKNTNNKDNNYIYKEGNNEYYYIGNKYKMDKKYGSIKVKLENPILIKVLNQKFNNGSKVLEGTLGQHRKTLQRYTKMIFGYSLNIDNFRHLQSTWLLENFKNLGLTKEDLKKYSLYSGHDLNTKISQYWRD